MQGSAVCPQMEFGHVLELLALPQGGRAESRAGCGAACEVSERELTCIKLGSFFLVTLYTKLNITQELCGCLETEGYFWATLSCLSVGKGGEGAVGIGGAVCQFSGSGTSWSRQTGTQAAPRAELNSASAC